ncbi:hypothetical protein C8A00DRAFT_35187, partial [Chaetomidium leptoderma]
MTTGLSPPSASKTLQLQPKKSHFRLRSDSGLALHTNQSALRQYTDNNSDGSVSTRPCRPRTLSSDGNSSVEDFSLGHRLNVELRGFVCNGKVLPDFFEPAVVKLAFSNPATGERLRQFAETRYGGSDVEFLLKVEEYSRALGDIISSMSYMSSHFTSTTATSPLGLPLEVASALKSNIRYCTRTALPALDKVYQEAKSTAEERLSRTLYPEFIKYQLSQCLTASLSATRPLTGGFKTPYPGLGDAFCLTDPLQPDNPIVHASDGLLAMSGYLRREILGKNCRLLQGVATDPEAICRVSQSLALSKEVTELVINYRPDGTPYWNLVFICPLMENGSVRYFFGAQVNISENMVSDYRDILGVLNFGPPPEEAQSTRASGSPTSPSLPTRQSSDNLDLDRTDEQQGGEKGGSSRRHRFFRRFGRKSPSSRTSSPSRHSTTSEQTTDDNSPPPPSPPACYYPPLSPRPPEHHFQHHHQQQQQQQQHQQLDEHSTPYSRFFVMRYNNNNNKNTPPTHRKKLQPHHPQTNPPNPNNPQDRHHLPIAFTSPYALTLLNLPPHDSDADALVDRDIFAVLATHLALPAVNRPAFRANVMSKLGRGETVTVDLMAPSSSSFSGSGSGSGSSTTAGWEVGGGGG